MPESSVLADIPAAVARAAETDGFSGVVLIRRGEDTLHSCVTGLAQRAWQVPHTLDTRFRVASVSKMFTAVGVLQLVERGLLDLDAPIVELLDLAETTISAQVTVRQLLTMTGGIADWFDETGDWEATWAELLRTHPVYLLRRNADYLPLFADKPARFPPGERHEYNGASYILLGMLIEQLTMAPFAEHLREHVFGPAAMTDTDLLPLEADVPRVADGYVPARDGTGAITGWTRNIYATTPEPAADGGATATAADLIAFTQALRAGALLPDQAVAEMLAPRVAEREEKVRGYLWRYGYGVMSILDDDGTVIRWGHTGEEDGVSTRLYHYPSLNIDVAICANTSWSAGKLAWNIHDLLLP